MSRTATQPKFDAVEQAITAAEAEGRDCRQARELLNVARDLAGCEVVRLADRRTARRPALPNR